MARKFQLGQIVKIVNKAKGGSRKFEVIKVYTHEDVNTSVVFKDLKNKRKYWRNVMTDKNGNEYAEYTLNTPYYEGNLKCFLA